MVVMDPVPLPYFRHPDELPAALPTRTEIEAATTTLPTTRHAAYDGRIVVIGEHFVVKYGQRVSENEGYAMLYIENHLSSFPAPRLYAMYRAEERLFLVMELMPGKDLESFWPHLSEDDKVSISQQLRSIWDRMRSLPSPGLYCNMTKGPLPFRFFLTLDKNPAINGPFTTAKDFALALALQSKRNWKYNNRKGWISEYFARNLPKVLKDNRSTFSHSDIHRKNILINEISATGDEERKFVVTAVLDWEAAGWYPMYWEYASTFVDMGWWDDWAEKLEIILDSWPSETGMLRMVRQDLDY